MIAYILHVTVITTICFLFYKLLLQKETFYHLNRWFLTGCLAVSFGLPLLPVPREFSWRDKWSEPADQPDFRPTASRTNADPTLNASSTDAPAVIVLPVASADQKTAAIAGHKRGQNKPDKRKTLVGKGDGAAIPQSASVVGGTSIMPAASDPRTSPVEKSRVEGPSQGRNEGTGGPAASFFLVLTWLFYVYLFGVLLFGGSFLLQIAVLLYQSYSRPVIRDGRFRIVEVRGNRAPCSFGNTIFINPENYDWETYNQILIHEKIHVSGRHTLDILLAETAVVLQWFNPFVWWYRREVENNLEFLTDASVLLHRDVERSAYQLSLLRVSAPHLPFGITNNYNQSLLKRRIVMMNSKRSSVHTVWKYFFLLPVFSLLVCALNKPAAFGATVKPIGSDHSGNAAGGGSLTPANNGRLPGFLANLASALTDTTIRPSSGNRSSREGSQDSSGDHRYYNDDDYQVLKAYSQGQKYVDDQLNVDLAAAQKAFLQLHMNDQQFQLQQNAFMDDEMKMAGQQLKISNQALKLAGQDLNMKYIDLQPAMNLNLDIHSKVDPAIVLSHLDRIGDSGIREGAWFATSSGDKLRIELKSGDDDHNWSSTFSVDKKEINPYPGQGNVEFKLTREAGTISFKGQFDGQEGFGHFQFAPADGYMAALKQMGVEDMDDRRQFSYFTLDIKKDYVNMLVHNGYPHISQRDLISFAAMKIDKDFIQQWHGSGYDEADNPRTLISLKAMNIDRAYADEMKGAGYDHLSVHDLMSLRAMKVDRAYIRSLGRNRDNMPIPIREVISYKAMHIDSGYVEGLRKVGYTDLSRNEVTSLYAMHVTPEYIKSLQDLGYTNVPVRELTSLKAMNITPESVKSYREMGFKDLNVRELTSLKAMNVTPEFIKGFRDVGYNDLSPRELSSLKAMNVTPDFVAAFKKIGFDHIPVHMLTSLKAMGVDADYVAKMKAKGFVSEDLNKYIRLKNDFN